MQPPTGTASRRTWTDAERATHLAALGRVLDRHPNLEVDDPGGLVRAPSVAALPPPPVSAAVVPPPPAKPATSAPRAFTPSPGATAILVTAPLRPSLAPQIEDAMIELGVAVVFDSQERVKTERYRGATYDTTVTELHVAAVAAPDQLDAVVEVLAGLRLKLTFSEVDNVVVEDEPEAAAPPAPPASVAAVAPPVPAASPAPDASAAPTRDIGLARVVALADPRFADAVDDVFRSLGLVDATATRTARMEVSTYRGSRSERQVATIRAEAWVPEPHARLVANHLAEAAHLRVDDPNRLWIEPTAPSTVPAVAAPEADAAPTVPSATVTMDPSLPPPPGPPAAGSATAALDPRKLVPRGAPAFVDHGR